MLIFVFMKAVARQQSEPYKNFISSIESQATKQNYHIIFSYFMKFCNIDDYTDVLKIQPAKLASLIRDYIIYLKDGKKLSPATVSAYIAPISHFCEMNDVILNWKQIKKFKAKSAA